MTEAFVLGGVRTPVGRYGGSLSHIRTDDLLGQTMVWACERVGVDLDRIEDIAAGCGTRSRATAARSPRDRARRRAPPTRGDDRRGRNRSRRSRSVPPGTALLAVASRRRSAPCSSEQRLIRRSDVAGRPIRCTFATCQIGVAFPIAILCSGRGTALALSSPACLGDRIDRADQCPAGLLTASACVRAQPAVLVVLRVPLALLTGATTGVRAGLQHGRKGGRLIASQPGGDPTCRFADVCAVEAQTDGEPQRSDIVFCYGRVGAGSAGLRAGEALLDAPDELLILARGSGGM